MAKIVLAKLRITGFISLIYLHWVSQISKARKTTGEFTNTRQVIQEAQNLQMTVFTQVLSPFKYAIITDLAAIENKGDSAISIGEFLLLKRLGIEVVGYCFSGVCDNRSSYEDIKNRTERLYDPQVAFILTILAISIFLVSLPEFATFSIFTVVTVSWQWIFGRKLGLSASVSNSACAKTVLRTV